MTLMRSGRRGWEDSVDIEVVVTPGLGDNSYILLSGDEAAIIDPQRDAWRFAQLAEQRSAAVRAVLETHVHNDYVSGAMELRAGTGAQIVAPAKGGYEFPHRAADEGDEIVIGDVRLVAIATPGHTYEHLSWLAYPLDGGDPVAVFSGGSLLVGSAGRTDLLGAEHTDALTSAQYRTLRRLAALPPSVRVLPTHGAGSFCVAAMPTTQRTSTIGAECRDNPLITAADLTEFEIELRDELMAYPHYYRYMAPINRRGPAPLGGLPGVRALSAEQVAAQAAGGAWIVDGRDRDDFAAGHIPGSVNIELNSGFGGYVGWVLPYDAPVVLVLPDRPDALTEATTQLIRIGWSAIAGHLAGGIAAWIAGDRPVRAYPAGGVAELCDAMASGAQLNVLDVRQELEWAWGGVPDSQRVFVADLPGRLDDLPTDRPNWVICSNGHRAAIAASLLDRADIPVRLVGTGGVGELRQRCPAGAAAR